MREISKSFISGTTKPMEDPIMSTPSHHPGQQGELRMGKIGQDLVELLAFGFFCTLRYVCKTLRPFISRTMKPREDPITWAAAHHRSLQNELPTAEI